MENRIRIMLINLINDRGNICSYCDCVNCKHLRMDIACKDDVNYESFLPSMQFEETVKSIMDLFKYEVSLETEYKDKLIGIEASKIGTFDSDWNKMLVAQTERCAEYLEKDVKLLKERINYLKDKNI